MNELGESTICFIYTPPFSFPDRSGTAVDLGSATPGALYTLRAGKTERRGGYFAAALGYHRLCTYQAHAAFRCIIRTQHCESDTRLEETDIHISGI